MCHMIIAFARKLLLSLVANMKEKRNLSFLRNNVIYSNECWHALLVLMNGIKLSHRLVVKHGVTHSD
jgi:hypothetical protein